MSRRALLLEGSVLLFFTYHPVLSVNDCAAFQEATVEKGEMLSQTRKGSCTLAASSARRVGADLGPPLHSWLFS